MSRSHHSARRRPRSVSPYRRTHLLQMKASFSHHLLLRRCRHRSQAPATLMTPPLHQAREVTRKAPTVKALLQRQAESQAPRAGSLLTSLRSAALLRVWELAWWPPWVGNREPRIPSWMRTPSRPSSPSTRTGMPTSASCSKVPAHKAWT